MFFKYLPTGLSAVSFLIAISGCGAKQDDGIAKSNSNNSKNGNSRDNTVAVQDAVVPPKEYYDALLTDRMRLLDQGSLNNHTEQVLWVNFNGATITKGYGNGQSFIVCSKSVTIPASGYSTADQTLILNQVAQYFSNAGVAVALTFDKPTSGDFTTMIVGGTYALLGCGASSSTLGIAPYDVDNANPNDLGFAFVPSSKNLETQAMTIAHEAGHTFGLDHTDNRIDLMYPTVSSQETGFAIGKSETGHSIQNGPLMLQKNLGSGFASLSGSPVQPSGAIPTPEPIPSTTIPTFPNAPANNPAIAGLPGIAGLGGLSQILGQLNPTLMGKLSPLLPILGAIPGGTFLANPQMILSALTLLQNGAAKQNGGTFNIGSLLSTLKGPQSVTFGSSVLSILGVATGGTSIGTLAPIAISSLGNSSQTASQPCDVAALLGMSNVANQGSLIALIPQYAQAIHANASGTQAQALTDAVKIAVGQTYISIGANQP